MDDERPMHLEDLRRRVALDRYEVDPGRVAAAIVERLLAGALLRAPADRD